MKKSFTVLIITLLTMTTLWAQVPQKMSYQAVIRDANNNLVVNQTVGMRISILQGSVNGTAVYVETQSPSTNANGLVTIEVGTGSTSNDFSLIDWSTNIYFVKTETDITGGTNYTITGVNQLMSVPYALHSKSSETFTGVLNEVDPVFTAWDKSTGVQITESQITDLQEYITVETDPLFSSWDKSTGIEITESQITDLQEYITEETDPLFSAWNKSTGIEITESQITDLQVYITEETDPVFFAWDKSTGIEITESQITDLQEYITEETDPVFSAWDKSTGINILASQVSDLEDYISVMPDGTYTGEMMYWDGTKWHSVIPGKEEQILRFCNGKPMWGTSSCPELATITTVVASEISALTAKSGGEIMNDGDAIIIGKGIVWSEQTNPSIESNLGHNEEGDGEGSYISNLSELTPETTYYVRAYAINCVGVAYGNQISFITEELVLPTISTSPVTEVTANSAKSGGNLLNQGGDPYTVIRGIVWGLTSNPTINDNVGINVEGDGLGTFTSVLTNLEPGTIYYIRAFSTNVLGTGYGNEVNFQTASYIPGDGVSDVDGNDYNTIIIGNQEWMAENLKTTKYNDNTAIPYVTDNTEWKNLTSPAYCWYDNNEAVYKNSYGALYNWYTVNTGKLCPTGWKVPSDDDWTVLANHIIDNYPDINSNNIGDKLKSCRQVNSPLGNECETSVHPRWNSHDVYYGTNDFGFSASPGGYRYFWAATFTSIGQSGSWWSSTGLNENEARGRSIKYNFSDIQMLSFESLQSGYSVRCIKDND